jgi:hypothetical protein
MGLELAATSEPNLPRSNSLVIEAALLLRQEGIHMSQSTWDLVSEGIDIGVDWWLDVAKSSGLTGADLVARVTADSSSLSSGRRLREYFDGPAGRPLVALLLGTDQLGSVALRSTGTRPSLIVASVEARHAGSVGKPMSRPAPATVRAWKTAVARIDAALGPSHPSGVGPTPVVAA